jgi:hypothetical protein
MKESPYIIDKQCIFRETFNSETEVRKKGGVPTDVVFSNGIGIFNGTSSKINYQSIPSGTYSIRIKLKRLVLGTRYFWDISRGDNLGLGYILIDGGTIWVSSGTRYVDGVLTSTITSAAKEVVVSGTIVSTKQSLMSIGTRLDQPYYIDADIELFEIYSGTLTAEEVKNLYENKTKKGLNVNHAEQLGNEMINQSTWYTQAYWDVFQACWSQVGTTLHSNGNNGDIGKAGTWSVGETYVISITVNVISGVIYLPYDGAIAPYWISSSGTYVVYYTPDSGTSMYITSSNFLGDVTSLSIKKVVVNSAREILNVSAQDGTVRNKYSGDMIGSELITDPYFNTQTSNNLITYGNNTRTFNPTQNGYSLRTEFVDSGYVCYGELYAAGTHPLVSSDLLTTKRYTFSFTYKTNLAVNLSLYRINGGAGWTIYPAINDGQWHTFTENSFYVVGNVTQFYVDGFSAGGYFEIKDLVCREVVPSVIPANVSIVKEGDINAIKFLGYNSSLVNTGSYDPLVGDKTVIAWVKFLDLKQYYMIFDNGKLQISLNVFSALNRISVTSDAATIIYTPNYSIVAKRYYLLTVTRTSAGVATIYLNGIVSGTPNQSTGTPAAGTLNMNIGYIQWGYGNHMLDKVRIIDGILTPQEISQIYSNERNKYNV